MNERETIRKLLILERGPWHLVPDSQVWTDPVTGYTCIILKQVHGFLCGYVAVPRGHPAFGSPMGECELNVHGGVTWAGHLPPWGGWLFGFDCAHYGDTNPGLDALLKSLHRGGKFVDLDQGSVWRDVAFVKAGLRKMADQLLSLESDVLALSDQEPLAPAPPKDPPAP